MHKGSFGRYECIYNTGSSRDVERWLRTSHKLEDMTKPLWEFKGTLDEANFGMNYICCIERIAEGLVKSEQRDSVWYTEILDSAEWKKYLKGEWDV